MTSESAELAAARQDFIDSWGSMGSSWGVSRSMAEVHGLLLVSRAPLSTDQVMEELDISRGNANTNLRELVSWGLVRSVRVRGERREFFDAEKDVWRITCTVIRERKRREIEPTLEMLQDCTRRTAPLRSADARAFHDQVSALADFARVASSIADRAVARQQSQVVPALLKLLR